ncbi:hypothetical protein NECAME_09442 [Necator americanus]|uniref:Nucleolar protein 10-like N-terminal domain-containing protein n=1 Tax=Necator americanus TaxID=51031 RepID=W2TDE8_NECAM|nr:hypothetical protein NECAME_09442 [Necator americanus]ETN80075.1 hypothetical protein NECAME_09442 [Necator americanus]
MNSVYSVNAYTKLATDCDVVTVVQMQVASINDVKIYNLSAGKSIPEWMSSEARRKAERKSVGGYFTDNLTLKKPKL